jgi:hypothetical protein
MSAHAMEEMAEDLLDIVDIENALLHGQITRIERGDPRGTKYIVEGIASEQSTHWHRRTFHWYWTLSDYHGLRD